MDIFINSFDDPYILVLKSFLVFLQHVVLVIKEKRVS